MNNLSRSNDNEPGNSNPPCPFCGKHSRIDSSPAPSKNPQQGRSYLRRRHYRCSGTPSHPFVTDEILAHGKPMLVQKSSDHVVPFDFGKLVESLRMAGSPKYDQKIYIELAQDITNLAYQRAQPSMPGVDGRVVASRDIGRIALFVLRRERYFAMWIRYSLIFKDLDGKDVNVDDILRTLRSEWESPQ